MPLRWVGKRDLGNSKDREKERNGSERRGIRTESEEKKEQVRRRELQKAKQKE